MGLFKKSKKEEAPANFFNVPRNDEGFQKVVDWVKSADELIVGLEENGNWKIGKDAEGRLFIPVYTDVLSMRPLPKKGDKFATVKFDSLREMFEHYSELDFVWLNRNSDSVQLNRTTFTHRYQMPAGVKINIGLPANPPQKLIDFLVTYGKQHDFVDKIYLALIERNQEFSYLVYVQHHADYDIVPEIGTTAGKVANTEHYPYPVDFAQNGEIFKEDEKYLIYEK
ncbi:enhanced serine sensitivity protein SseB C-terminal domain-containing protein [Lactococcus nasutitermitis]|uniref:Enhanced serine sensitivity protein SseB C-terminal domain-containing protein n=1 Tax=Lactococcus nasutitermitis TaxID=1652957 RepID=A0ABV9JF37_9LACT|nr:enhanced serine sensitivity protein SseB C-terminal domain-containing protein [Lactococcus nasutitermitis]